MWANKRMRELKEPLLSGKITLEEYKNQILAEIKP
jgi:hypothetical protein